MSRHSPYLGRFNAFLVSLLLLTLSSFTTVMAASSPPVITGISPNNIQAEGGIPVTITGHGLSAATSAIIGGVEVMDLQVIDDETIVVVTSADMDAYSQEVRVNTPNGTSTVSGLLNMDPVQQGRAANNDVPSGTQSQGLLNGTSAVTGGINNNLFNLQSGGGEEGSSGGIAAAIAAAIDDGVVTGQGDGPEDPIAIRTPRSRQWQVFSTLNYANVKLNAVGAQAGVQVDAWVPSVGIQRHLSPRLAVGFAVSFLHSEQGYTGGLGSLQLEGPAFTTYLSYVRQNYWSSLLYNFGTYDFNSTRNPGAGALAYGSSRTYTNALQYNTGWNFRFQNNTLVTGPFVGLDYLYGSVSAYNETGGGGAALNYRRQSFQSLVSRVGWSVSKKLHTSWATVTPQVRLSYERQNLANNGTSNAAINAPFAPGASKQPGQDYLVAAAGLNFAFNDQFSLQLTYQGQFFRQDMQAHFGGLRFSYSF